MHTNMKKGMTLLETMIAVTIFSILMTVALSSTLDYFKLIAAQEATVRADQRGNLALNNIADELKPAILPVYVKGSSGTVFADIDHEFRGFGGRMGRRWLEELQDGMDSIAFIVPIDAQGVGQETAGTGNYTVDYLDSNGQLQTGQTRGPDQNYLGSNATLTTSPEYEFILRDRSIDEHVNTLVFLDPVLFGGDAFAEIAEPTDSDWDGVADGALLPIRSFMAIRFVNLLDGGSPVIVNEANSVVSHNGNPVPVDLDGNGDESGEFQVGMLQLVYSGGLVCVVRGGNVLIETVDQITVPLTPYNVLRAREDNDRTPIFRLEGLSIGGDSTEGHNQVRVRFLMLDGKAVTDAGRIEDSIYRLSGSMSARWYQTVVTLRNMER